MAFGAEELRVLRRALALALHPSPASAEDVQDCLRLAESVDEAAREGARLRAFLLADLARYRAALPGAVTGYLTLLEEALSDGYRPTQDDLAALRALRGNPAAATLLNRCRAPAERPRLTALPGGLAPSGPQGACAATEEPEEKPAKKPAPRPQPKPKPQPEPKPSQPHRPIPTPGEVFPPKRKPPAPPAKPSEQLVAG
ncbi:hypothetical protein FE633_39365 [Streptomyces montanus]|uniref:Uncharacterized protein n=1 Tax=Streptomyces montanus TaxID=2580423 RepID=A0A5R9FMM8_9ACTN|nr:hypothetical protein [Streptomyces montanus]TLS40815.1 hypothetical protein FE633_39365 [Streptomyces montanus]